MPLAKGERRKTESVVRTKLTPPRLSAKTVERERVSGLLDMSADRALTVVRAPSGFGKTTSVAIWRRQALNRGRCVGWVTLDGDDDDPSQVLLLISCALAEALGGQAHDLPEFRRSGEWASPEVAAISLVNALDQIDSDVTLNVASAVRRTAPRSQPSGHTSPGTARSFLLLL